MKTTIEIRDELLLRAKRWSKRTGKPLRALFEEALQQALDEDPPAHFELVDRSVGRAGDPNPLELRSWQDLRDEIYGTPDGR